MAWPSAYEDVVGYAFWPGDYAEQVRARGFDVIADAIAPPSDNRRPARVATTGSAIASEDAGGASGACGDAAAAPVSWPGTRIEQTLQLSNAQHDALGKLQAALTQEIATIKAGCRDTAALPPRERLHVVVQQLWAVRDAGVFIRAPLKAFYDSLSEAQKAGFASQLQPPSAGDAKSANAGMGQQVQACAARGVGNAERMVKQIEQRVQPTQQQSAGLEALRKTSTDMAKLLSVSCTQPIPADPLARLDAADNQLTSMNYAATSMEIALNGFYVQLSGEQKAKFNGSGR